MPGADTRSTIGIGAHARYAHSSTSVSASTSNGNDSKPCAHASSDSGGAPSWASAPATNKSESACVEPPHPRARLVFDKLASAPAAMQTLVANRDARLRLRAAASHVTSWLAAKEQRSRASKGPKGRGAAEAVPAESRQHHVTECVEYTEEDFEFRALADWILYECDRHERLPDFWERVRQLRQSSEPGDADGDADGVPTRKRPREGAAFPSAAAAAAFGHAGDVSPRCSPRCAPLPASPLGVMSSPLVR